MELQKGRYQLISEEIRTGAKEVFDFSSSNLDFVSSEDSVFSKVPVAAIDKLTSAFTSFEELNEYSERNCSYDREWGSKCYIRYKSNTTKEDAFLTPIWNDECLYRIASCANGSRVDFTDSTTEEMFKDMYRELGDRNSGFASSILKSRSNDTSLNKHNKILVEIAPNNKNDPNFLREMQRAFSSYREFRALYIAYCQYNKKLGKEAPHVLRKN